VEPRSTIIRHEELKALLGVFALGIADAEEAAALRTHLATCAECQAELAELTAAVDALPLGLDPIAPPSSLRDRIAAAVQAEGDSTKTPERASTPPATVPAAPPRPVAAPQAIRPAAWWANARLWATAAAVLLLVAAGLLVWNLRLQSELRGAAPQTVALAPTDAAPGASGEVRYLPQSNLLVVDVRDLPPLPSGEVYEVWLIPHEGAPVAAGTFDQPTAQHAVVADRGQYQAIAITPEPGPLGTTAPTGQIVAQAAL
jgi:anti-sigma-K factor RskA